MVGCILEEHPEHPELQKYIHGPPGPKLAVLYVGRCIFNNLEYVGLHKHGKTGRSTWISRINDHAVNKRASGTRIHRSITAHGMENHRWQIVWHGREEEVDTAEHNATLPTGRNTISPNGLNLKAGGSSSFHSEETRAKQRQAAKAQQERARVGGDKTISDHGNHWWATASKEEVDRAHEARTAAHRTPEYRKQRSEIAKNISSAGRSKIGAASKKRMSDRDYSAMIADKRRATIEKKREIAMQSMNEEEKAAYMKRCAAMDRDYARTSKQLEALRKVKPGCSVKDIPIARREGWLPSI